MDFKKGQKVVVVNEKYAFYDIKGLEGYIGIGTIFESYVDDNGNEVLRAKLDDTEIIVEAGKLTNLKFHDPSLYIDKAKEASDDLEFKLKRANVALYELEMAASFNSAISKK